MLIFNIQRLEANVRTGGCNHRARHRAKEGRWVCGAGEVDVLVTGVDLDFTGFSQEVGTHVNTVGISALTNIYVNSRFTPNVQHSVGGD